MPLKMTVICKDCKTLITFIGFGSTIFFFFYAFQEHFDMQRLYHMDYIHGISLQDVFPHDLEENYDMQRLYHTSFLIRFLSSYVFFYALEESFDKKRLYLTD